MHLFDNLAGETVLENDRVVVERHLLQPGQHTGLQTRSHPQLLVYIRGGVLTAEDGRATLWKEGRVQWFDEDESAGPSRVNTGDAEIDFVSITLKPVPPGSAVPEWKVEPICYPNVVGEDLLDNGWVIVQRFLFEPGQWEGVHAHQPNMLFVHVRGGHWGARSNLEPYAAYPEASPDGSVGWMEPVDIDVGHESCNIGSNPIDLVWISLKLGGARRR